MDLISPHLSVPERLTQIERVLGDIHGRLFGNGQPGELESIRADNSRKLAHVWKAIDGLRAWRWQISGGVAAALAAIELFKAWASKP